LIVVQAPLRISFLGGGTDFPDFYSAHGGAVISSAIDKYVYVIVKERFDDFICINYSKREIVQAIDDIEHDLVREAMRKTAVSKGVEITTLADVPGEGTGLGSSSSVTVALLQALYAYQGESKTARDLAEEACQIEIDILGKPIGKQDQYIAAHGGIRFISFNGHSHPQATRVTLERKTRQRLGDSLLLFYTGVSRKADPILVEQRANIPDRIEVLCQMKQLAHEGMDSLLQGEVERFGELLHQGWDLKKRLAKKITNPGIDEMYERARKAGALGGKIAGAGGGGFLLLCCPDGRRERVREVLGSMRELPFHFENDGSKVIFNYRRYLG
jgi:D-glycero-alpha-D-manno-heptose-7-phosphate kinase